MLAVVFKQSLKESLRLNKLLPWFLLGGLTFFIALWSTSLGDKTEAVMRYGNLSYLFVFRLLVLSAAIVTSTIVSAEVEQKTIVYLLTRPIPRWVLYLGRYLACSSVVAAVSCCCAVATSLAIFGPNLQANSLLGRDCIALIVGAFAYCGLFGLITLMFNRAMIVCLLFGFGWEASVPNMPGSVYYLSIYSHLQTIAQHPKSDMSGIIALLSGSLGGNNLTLMVSIPALIGLILVTVGLSLWLFSSAEFVPREDVE